MKISSAYALLIPLGRQHQLTNASKKDCMVMQNQARITSSLAFGKAIAEEGKPNEIVSIPGLRNRPQRRFPCRNLAFYIPGEEWKKLSRSYRMRLCKVANYKSWLAAQLSWQACSPAAVFISQAIWIHTGLDTRIGYPTRQSWQVSDREVKSPMYATSVRLGALQDSKT